MSSTRILLWSIFTAYSESFLWIDVTLCIKIIHILFCKVKTLSRVSSVYISPWKHKNTCHELGATPLRCVSLIKPFSRDNREFQWTKLKVSWCIQTVPLLLAHKLFTELKNVGWLLSYESFMIAFYFFSVTGFFFDFGTFFCPFIASLTFGSYSSNQVGKNSFWMNFMILQMILSYL